jgi:hypothetical protein
MSTFDFTLRARSDAVSPFRPASAPVRASAGPTVRLLAVVALASAATGGLATLVLEQLLGATEPPHLAPVAPASSGPSLYPTPDVPAAHDVFRDHAEPPIEPPPTF